MNGVKTLGAEPVLQVLGLRLRHSKQSALRAKFAGSDEGSARGIAHGAFPSGVDSEVVCF